MLRSNSYFKFLTFLLMFLFSVLFVNANVNVVDVEVSENVYQLVYYDPLETGAGLYFDTTENQTAYDITGNIVITNNHPNETIHDIGLNITSITEISNMSFSGGSTGFVSQQTGSYIYLFVPELSPGASSNFTYDVNVTGIAPPLNMTTNYSDSRMFTGLPFTVTDTLSNTLDEGTYSDTCIHDIVITQSSLNITQGSDSLNFTFEPGSITGQDSVNASISADNRTLTWTPHGGECLSHDNTTDINYDINTPAELSTASTYSFINSTTTYSLNSSISQINIETIDASGDLEVRFDKYQVNILTGDNATWNITSYVTSQSNLTVNLTEVSLWVSVRNGTGTGFTNPSIIDNDTISGEALNFSYAPNVLLNMTSTPWNNTDGAWLFNYTFSSSPIVWMDLSNSLHNDGIQITNQSITYGENEVYIKEIYLATGYWLEITKNITRFGDNNYTILIEVRNRGTATTPNGQAVVIYNFLPIDFSLDSIFDYSSSPWYNTSETNDTLADPIYNGTMYQYALIPNGNPANSSLDRYSGSYNVNNTWSVTYNVSGSGEFVFEDLFLTGVDPLNVKEYGATTALKSESAYKVLSASGEYLLSGIAAIVGIVILLL